jgi:myo-inositol-1(or 4)-monophosphatase
VPASELEQYPGPDAATTAEVERTAFHLARAAGARIRAAYGRQLQVDFKPSAAGRPRNSNPVSDADRRIESFIRSRLSNTYPEHAVIGEELPATGAAPFTWVIDPIDGTSNFINGLPLFACSIGVLFHGRPIAGAIWCACSHALRPGTYHAAAHGPLKFDGRELTRRSQGSWRGLAGEPGGAPAHAAGWDTRVLGCATIEFAFVAAGLLSIAYIPRPMLWDAAAGLALLHAAGCRAVARRAGSWDTMLYFPVPPAAAATLADWSEPLLIGSGAEIERASGARNRSC